MDVEKERLKAKEPGKTQPISRQKEELGNLIAKSSVVWVPTVASSRIMSNKRQDSNDNSRESEEEDDDSGNSPASNDSFTANC